MTTHRPAEAIGTMTPTEAMARGLVVALLPSLEAAMLAGGRYTVAMAEAWRIVSADWQARHGATVTARAGEILRDVGPATILTPQGRAAFLEAYPLGAIPTPPPAEAIVPPREAIGGRLRQAWLCFWRVPPASSA